MQDGCSQKNGSRQKLAAVLVRLKHRARRQSYDKNQYHKLSVCHHLLTTAAKTLVIHYYYGAVLAPAIIITKKYYRLQFAVVCCLQQPLASFDKDTRHLLLLKGKNQQVSPDLAHLENELVLTSTYILVGRNALQAGSSLLRCSFLA